MRYFLLTDNTDTLVGMRLAGIEGRFCKNKAEVSDALSDARADSSIAILLINESLSALCPELIYDLKLNCRTPLVVEIPDRNQPSRSAGAITQYVREAIGIKI